MSRREDRTSRPTTIYPTSQRTEPKTKSKHQTKQPTSQPTDRADPSTTSFKTTNHPINQNQRHCAPFFPTTHAASCPEPAGCSQTSTLRPCSPKSDGRTRPHRRLYETETEGSPPVWCVDWGSVVRCIGTFHVLSLPNRPHDTVPAVCASTDAPQKDHTHPGAARRYQWRKTPARSWPPPGRGT
jgi:hypothetical protein